MITSAPNPPWRWLKTSVRKQNKDSMKTIWGGIGDNEVLTHKSWISLCLIIEWIKEYQTINSKPCVFFPDYYCYDTIFQIINDIDIVYYPVEKDLQPDIKRCRELAKLKKPNAIVFCHFFGIPKEINDISILAKQHGAILIEDAAHMLYSENIGKSSDFILFSPWKLLGLPDGAILVIGKKNTCDKDHNRLQSWFVKKQSQYVNYNRFIRIWKIKKVIQKLLPNIKKGSKNDLSPELLKVSAKESRYKISDYSARLLQHQTREEILKVGERRKENLLYLNDFCQRKYDLKPKYDFGDNIPYTAIYDIKDVKTAKVCEALGRIGKVISRWPSLAPELPEDSIAGELLEDSLMISVHQGLKLNCLVKCLKDQIAITLDKEMIIRQINVEEYKQYTEQADGFLPLLQTDVWGTAKKESQNWEVHYNIIEYFGKSVACYMALQKTMLARVTRINRGILWLEDTEKTSKEKIYNALKKHYTGFGKLLFLSSQEMRTADNLSMLIRGGYQYRNRFYSTGLIDLRVEEEVLRKNLDSKWRNHLKQAEAKGMEIKKITMPDELEELLQLHIKHKNDQKYDDSGDSITRELINGQAIISYVAKKHGETVGFVMVVKHGKSATYYIGWNNETGYRLDANKLLLWQAMLALKKENIVWFDLGGIDYIATRSIADFKLGTGCGYYESLGEFVGM